MAYFLFAVPVLAIAAALFAGSRAARKHGARRAMAVHFVTLAIAFSVLTLTGVAVSAAPADDNAADTPAAISAEDGAEADTEASGDINLGLKAIAAALATGLAGIGSGFAVASGAPAAIGAISENPSVFGKAMIFVALGEAIALYGVIISVLIIFIL